MKLPKFTFRFPFKLPKFGKREQDVLEKAIPVLTDVALDAAKEQTAPQAPKRDAIWWIKLVVLAAIAVVPILVDAFPDQTWDDNLATAVTVIAALLGLKHAAGKPK